MNTQAARYDGVVDTGRYPIGDPASAAYATRSTSSPSMIPRARGTPGRGAWPRINSVLTYGERPGMKLTELTQQLFYGRTA